MPVPAYEARAEFFRMLGHPTRIGMLELTQDGPEPRTRTTVAVR